MPDFTRPRAPYGWKRQDGQVTMAARRTRKILWWVGGILLGIIILIAAMPLWLPWILRPLASREGAQFSSYEREGYSRFTLKGVHYSSAAATLDAERVEGVVPLTWLWKHYVGGDLGGNWLVVDHWKLNLAPSPEKSTNAAGSPYQTMEKVQNLLPAAESWLPRAALSNGVVRLGTNEISVDSIVWKEGTLQARAAAKQAGQKISVLAEVMATGTNRVTIDITPLAVQVRLGVSRDAGALRISGEGDWRTNRVVLSAEFGRDDLWPRTARVEAASVRVPADVTKLEGFQEWTGSLRVDWATNQFFLDLSADAQPVADKASGLSEVRATVRASGDTNRVRVQKLDVALPGLAASLSKPLEFDLEGNFLGREARLQIAADLSRQNFLQATGGLSGEALIFSSEKKFPGLDFVLAGKNIGARGVLAESVDLRGNLDWPWLRVDQAEIKMKGASARAQMRANVVAQLVDTGSVQVEGKAGAEWLPDGYDFERVETRIEFSGPFERVSHQGQLRVFGLESPSWRTMNVSANWRGKMSELDAFDTTLATGLGSLAVAGAGYSRTNQTRLDLSTLTLRGTNGDLLALREPARIRVQHEPGTNLVVEVSPLRWEGPGGGLDLEASMRWPREGRISMTATNLRSDLAKPFLIQALPEARLNSAGMTGSWSNGPATLKVSVDATYIGTNDTVFSALVNVSSTNSGLAIDDFWVSSKREQIIDGKGFLPVTIEPASTGGLVNVRSNAPISFRARTRPNAEFWDELAALAGIRLQNPALDLALSGTLFSPEGKVSFSADEISYLKAGTNKFPRLQKIRADADITRALAKLSEFTLLVENQPLRVTGEMPLPADFKGGVGSLDWRKADGRVTVEKFQLSAIEPYYGEYLAPQGTVDLDLSLHRGRMEGKLVVTNAATRPLGPLGVAQDAQAVITFAGEEIRIDRLGALLGGEPIFLSGVIDLGKTNSANHLPVFALKVRGENVPLARQPEVILRSDLDISLVNSNAAEPLISGTVNLRESFYLGDITQLIPGNVSAPGKRPPFFSVDNPILADWRLQLRVRGDHFLQVRTPFFKGTISTTMRLENTLREPLAIGEVRIEEGTILFPFANLYVKQGLISLSSEDPFHPQLFVNAASRAYGYDVRMAASGSADKPVIQFSSTPELTSEQVILMVTAGEVPKDEIHYSTQQKAQRFAMFIGKNILSKFGTDAGSERLTIRSGEEVSERGKETYSLEYKLTPRWSIYGEYDKYAAINAGLKWKVYSK